MMSDKSNGSSTRVPVDKHGGAKIHIWLAVLVVILLVDTGFGDTIWGAHQTAIVDALWKFRWNCIEWVSYTSAALLAVLYCLRSPSGTKKHSTPKKSFPKTCKTDAYAKGISKRQVASRRENYESTTPSPTKQWHLSIEQAVQNGDVELAQTLFQDMQRSGCLVYGFIPNIIMRGFTKKGDFAGAERWLTEMKSKGMEVSACTYNTILDACAKSNKPELCDKWISRMTGDGVSPTAVTFATLISMHARRGNEEKAELLLNQMKLAGVSPDEVCFNALIHACSTRGNFIGVGRWVDEMTNAGLQPSVTTFTAAIDACAKKGNIEEAEGWMNRMIGAGLQPNVVSYSSLMDACAKLRKPERASYWYDKMLEAGVTPNSYTFSAAISACAKSGDIAAAEAWLARAQDANAEVASDPVLYSGVIDACAKANDHCRAWRVFEQMRARGVRAHIVLYATLARPFAFHGDYQKVEEIEQMMKREGIAVNEYFLYAQLIAYGKARPRQVVKATDAFKKGVAQGLNINERILDALRRVIGRDNAIALCEEAKLARRGSPGNMANIVW